MYKCNNFKASLKDRFAVFRPCLVLSRKAVNGRSVYICVILVFFLQASMALQVRAAYSKQKLTLQGQNINFEELLENIRTQTGYEFLYAKDIVSRAKPVTINLKNAELEEALNQIFKNQPFGYVIKGKTLVITEKNVTNSVPSNTVNTYAVAAPVTGKVTDELGEPIAGATVAVKGKTQKAVTDSDGLFQLDVAVGDVLVFSYIGYMATEITVEGTGPINVSLRQDAQNLDEVVVSALGIKREAKSVTYAAQTVTAEDITRTREPNMINSLAGKAAGLVITKGASGPGSSSKILLRGNKSISGNNQPLYVIDGIPMNAADGAQGSTIFGTQDRGDAISNLNPDDIESMEILKGASAAALYGSQAANGVVMITTKKGRPGVSSVTLTSSTTLENPLVLPEIQTRYGQGTGGTANNTINDSWGPAISNGSDNHISNFFNTGKNFFNSVSIASGNDIAQVYASYGNTTANGIVPNNDYNRHNLNVRGTAKVLNDKVTLDGGVTYVRQSSFNRPQAGFYYSPIFSLYLFPPEDDMSNYSGSNFERWDDTRQMSVQNWPYIVNQASSNQNPYWLANRNQTDDIRNRNIYNFSARWDLLDWLYVQGRGTYDRAEDNFELRQYASSDPTLVGSNGGYQKRMSNTDQFYTDFIISGRGSISPSFNLSATLGTSWMHNRYYDLLLGNNGPNNTLSFPNYFSVYSLRNDAGGNFTHTESLQERETQAVFGTATLGYNDYLFLDLTARQEWSSTVEDNFFYPSIGLSYIITDHLGSSDFLSFAKWRASMAKVGNALPFGVSNFTPPYELDANGNIIGRTTVPYFDGNNFYSLKPERTTSYEIGADFRFFSDKLSLGVTYYDATTDDQVFSIAAPAGAGTQNYWINGGKIRNYGIEATASYSVNLGEVSWQPTLNFSTNVNQIRELSDLLDNEYFVLTAGGDTRLVQLFLTRPGVANLRGEKEYGSYGDLFGKVYERDDSGNVIMGDDGLPVLSASNDQYLGNANPSFLLGWGNQFRYKDFNLSFLLDGRFGGKIVSQTEQWLDWKGISRRTGEARDAGGVMIGGNLVDAQTYYNFISGAGDVAAAAEEYMYSASNIRLREVSFGYTIPLKWKGIESLNISAVGRNLFFLYKDAPFDPEVSITTSNALQGMDAFNLPSTRSYGLTLTAKF